MLSDLQNSNHLNQLAQTFCHRLQRHPSFRATHQLPSNFWHCHATALTGYFQSALALSPGAQHRQLHYEKIVQAQIPHLVRSRQALRIWLNLWIASIDDNFIGTKSNLAKTYARRLSTALSYRYMNVNLKANKIAVFH